MHRAFCCVGHTGVTRYAAEMSNVAARAPGGKSRMTRLVCSKVPQAVGKSSESMKEFTEGVSELLPGKERSFTGRKEAELGFGKG